MKPVPQYLRTGADNGGVEIRNLNNALFAALKCNANCCHANGALLKLSFSLGGSTKREKKTCSLKRKFFSSDWLENYFLKIA